MRLKSIEMQGFKSFADKIYLDFNPGITAIVGPNGSGKSNISDAIRWVMGEQSIKSLRGSKMEDVIFSGTETRKPLGFAEVTLTLDNSDQYFSLDFPEITVTRRVYRSGEGEYYINKTLCRLKDIHELFMDTGLGRDGYSIIGQGKIDGILSSKSDERRQIFEEAAGISKYKYRKIEAERKLEHTTENLVRVEDILSELESRIGPLERQSDKARKYLLLRDEMRELDITVSVINAEKSKLELKKLDENIDILNSQIESIKDSVSQTEQEISNLYEQLNVFDEEIEACRESDKNASGSINEKQNRLTLLKSNIEHNGQNIKRLKDEVSQSKAEVEKADESSLQITQLLDKLNAQSAGTAKSLEELTNEARKTGEASEEKNEALENYKSGIIEQTSEINALKASNNSLDILSENFLRRKSEVEQERLNKSSGSDELSEAKAKSEKEAEICLSEIDNLKQKISNSEKKATEYELNLKKLQENKNKYLIAVNQKISRKSMLADMEREYEGYARGVKAVMTAYKKGYIKGSKIYGPLAQLIKTDNKYIAAIETALGAANQNIVTASENDAKAAIEYLKRQKSGRATFLPVTAVKSKSFSFGSAKESMGFIAIASELVKCDTMYKDIVSSFLGGTIVCDTLDNAIVMAKKNSYRFKIVTLDGDIIQAGGAMTGGSRNKTAGSLSRSGEISQLEQEILKLNSDIESSANAITDMNETLERLRADLKSDNDALQLKSRDLVKFNSEKEHYEAMLKDITLSAEQLKTELLSIESRLSDIDNEKEKNNQSIIAKENDIHVIESKISAIQKEYTELSGKTGELGNQITELNIARNTILKDIEVQNERIMRIAAEKTQLAESISEKLESINELNKENSDSEKEIETLNSEIKNLQQSLNNFGEKIISLTGKRTDSEKLIRERQKSVKDVQEQLFNLTKQQGKMESQSAKFRLDIESIINRLLEDYELPYSEAAAIKPKEDFDYKTASAEIKALKEKIRALGNINIDAIEEYKEIKERFDFLGSQSADLKKAKTELESVITEMQEIMQMKFSKQFRIINENFNRVFGELFGGGRANLIMTDPDNILESGIEIEAQPPGKKLQSLTLLSGGERAFTAIALLFSILDVRPTPFCILDEIEAALDDVNVYRTADYLKRYSSKTQFIVVTHRRGTMEAANILYGVTMQERGISKLLSLNIDDVQN